MNKHEVDRTISRMKAVFTFNNFGDDRVTLEYSKVLKALDYKTVDAAIDALMLIDSKNLPPISELVKAAKEVQKKSATFVENKEHCTICNDTGYCLYNKDVDGINYQYIAHCTCEKGQSLAYDGRTVKDRQYVSPYIVDSVTQYFDDQAIRQMAKAQTISAEEKQKIRLQMAKMGLAMPQLKSEVAPWDR